MSKKRKKTRGERSISRPAPPQHASETPPASSIAPSPGGIDFRWGLVVFLIGLAAYLLVYFASPLPSLMVAGDDAAQLTRFDLAMWLWLIRLPELFSAWTGGSWRNVGLVDRLAVASAAVVLLALAQLMGRVLVTRKNGCAPDFSRLEIFLFAQAVGLSLLSIFTLLVGLAGWLHSPWPYVCLAIVVMLCSGWQFFRRSSLDEPASSASESSSVKSSMPGDWLPAGALWMLAPFVALLLLAAMCPPHDFDVREYHANAPKEWFLAGRIAFEPHNVYANMPLAAELLSLPAMACWPGERAWWWGTLVGKTVIASVTLFTSLALFAAGRRFFSTTAGVVAAAVYLSIPWIALVSTSGLIDGALAYYLFMAFFATGIYVARDSVAANSRSSQHADDVSQSPAATESRPTGLLMLAGFLAGSAAACKYPGLLFAVIPLALVVLLHRPRVIDASRATWRRRIAYFCVFLFAAFVAVGPWYGKNWAMTGNPVYPLAYNLFGGETRTPAKDAQWRKAHAVPSDEYGESYTPRQFGASLATVGWKSEWMSPIVWPLAALVLFTLLRWSKEGQTLPVRVTLLACGLTAWIFACWWLFTHRIDRFWLPLLPLAALVAGAGAVWTTARTWRHILVAILFWGLVWNLLVIAGVRSITPDGLLVALNQQRFDSTRVHRAHRYLNEHVPAGKRVLLVGDAEPFDLEVPAVWNTCFDDSILEVLLRDKTPQQQWAALQAQGVSHVLVRWSEVDRYRSPGNYGFTDYVTEQLFRDLVKSGVLKRPWGVRNAQTGESDRFIGEIYPVAESLSSTPSS